MVFRKVNNADCKILLELRNEPSVRALSLNCEEINIETHSKWFASALQSNDYYIYILENEQNEVVGSGRAKLKNSQYYLSWSVFSRFRGKGYGKLIVENLVANHLPCIAEIKEKNIPSLKIVESLGFSQVNEDNGVKLFLKE
tara:strand:+ start:40694 stop:41119 length:426 start_codon:yes stop_codon:yes gene_type:complete